MNIIQLEIMLHYTYCPDPFPVDSPIAREGVVMLVENGMIEETTYSRILNEGNHDKLVEPRKYHATEKGRVFVNALMSVPIPVQAWTMPKPT